MSDLKIHTVKAALYFFSVMSGTVHVNVASEFPNRTENSRICVFETNLAESEFCCSIRQNQKIRKIVCKTTQRKKKAINYNKQSIESNKYRIAHIWHLHFTC